MDSELNLDRFLELGITIFVVSMPGQPYSAVRAILQNDCTITMLLSSLNSYMALSLMSGDLSLPACVIISA